MPVRAAGAPSTSPRRARPDSVLIAQGNCYTSPNFTTSMAAGIVVRSGDGVVVVDLDMDGDERTGWTLVYLHIADATASQLGRLCRRAARLGAPPARGCT